MTSKAVLIDVPNLFYRAFHAIPQSLTAPSGESVNALYGTASSLIALLENLHPDYLFAFMDTKEATFRHKKEESYKAQRPEMPEELVGQLVKIDELYRAFSIPIFSLNGYEADDLIATFVKKFKEQDALEIAILSSDQDLYSLVGDRVYIIAPQKGNQFTKFNREDVKKKIGIYPEQVADYKSIAGDSSDNLKGIPGIGKKGSVELLEEYKNLEQILKNAEQVKGRKGKLLKEYQDEALRMKSLITLEDNVPMDFDLSKGSTSEIDYSTIEQFFRTYNFSSLLKRLAKFTNPPKSLKESSSGQLSLF
jgi:DNA polymerase-1